MKIVIDMPDDEYEICLSHRESIENMIRVHKCFSLEYAVIRGTPLPKGHGRLIDADALENEFDMLEKVTNEESFVEKTEHKKLLECISIAKTAQTIIEADTESEDEYDG